MIRTAAAPRPPSQRRSWRETWTKRWRVRRKKKKTVMTNTGAARPRVCPASPRLYAPSYASNRSTRPWRRGVRSWPCPWEEPGASREHRHGPAPKSSPSTPRPSPPWRPPSLRRRRRGGGGGCCFLTAEGREPHQSRSRVEPSTASTCCSPSSLSRYSNWTQLWL